MTYRALIVGVNTHGLLYRERDANLLSSALKQYHYEILLPGASKPSITETFESLVDGCALTDTVVVYFTGHAIIEKGKLWLLLADDASKLANKLDLNNLIDTFSGCAAERKLVILDCCHAGQAYEEWKPNISDRYFILVASARLQEGYEFEKLKASFLTYHLCQTLTDPPSDVTDGKNRISILRLHKHLEKVTREHNSLEDAREVPIPRLVGQHTDFSIGVVVDGTMGIQTLEWDTYRRAVLVRHQYVRLAVIAGARHDKFAQIPLKEIFVPQLVKSGIPAHEVSDTVLEWKRRIYASDQPPDEGIEPGRLIDSDLKSEAFIDPTISMELTGADEIISSVEPEGYEETESAIGILENILSVLGRERTQVFIGGPGCGKSTMLLYAMLSLCNPQSSREDLPFLRQDSPIPFLIELRQYVLPVNQGKGFVEYLADSMDNDYGVPVKKEAIEALLNSEGQALIFFDGLDEIFEPTERSRAIRQFQTFSTRYGQTRIVMTSRIAGYDPSDLVTADFKHYTMEHFTLQQIRQFVPQWYRYYTWEGDERHPSGLIRRIEENPRFMDLAGNPLLLTMMAILYKNEPLPEKRWKLYERCTAVLLEDWDIKRKDLKLNQVLPLDYPVSIDQKAEILRGVAQYMLEQGQENRELNAIFYDPLMKILADYLEREYRLSQGQARADARGILTYIRERTYILAEIGERIFGFVHRTFMEYFAAGYYKDEFNKRGADYLWLKDQVFGSYWQRDEWREVLLLLAAMLADQKSPMREVIDSLWKEYPSDPPINLAFAVECLAEAGAINQKDEHWAKELVTELIQKIKEYSGQAGDSPTKKFVDMGIQACSKLAAILSLSEEARLIIQHLDESKKLQQRMIGWQLNFTFQSREKRLDFALNALNDGQEAVRRGAIAALEREWPGNDQVSQALIKTVQADRYARVRQSAMEALARAWSENEAVLDAIEARIDEETAYTYVSYVIEYLSKNWKNHPKAYELVHKLAKPKSRASSDYDYVAVIRTAVKSLIEGWRDHPDILPWLKELVTSDLEVGVRQAAIDAIGLGWRDHPDILPWLKELATSDPEVGVRRAAVGAIGRVWRDQPDILLWLKELVASDPEVGVRRAAVEAIGKGWRDYPDILPWLKELATGDREEEVRQAAVGTIVQGWWGHPDILPWLQELAVSDQDLGMRQAAVGAIGRGWRDEPDILPWLQELATSDQETGVRRAAVGAFGRFWWGPPDILPIGRRWWGPLKFLPIGHGWRDYPDILPWLQELAVSDQDLGMRQVAAGAIVHGWWGHPDILPWLQELATGGQEVEVRQATVEAIGRGWRGHPDALPWLKELATSDPEVGVRLAAVGMIGRGWRDSPDILPWLQELAASDKEARVRRAAIEAIGQGWQDYPDILSWLQELATGYPEVEVRQASVGAIGRGWRDQPDILPWLQELATSDQEVGVRRAAVEAIGQGWRDFPDILPWLRELAVSDQDPSVRAIALLPINRLFFYYYYVNVSEILKKIDSSNIYLFGNRRDAKYRNFLLSRAKSDSDPEVREVAVQILKKLWAGDSKTQALVMELESKK
jgi:HEAT repeat protein